MSGLVYSPRVRKTCVRRRALYNRKTGQKLRLRNHRQFDSDVVNIKTNSWMFGNVLFFRLSGRKCIRSPKCWTFVFTEAVLYDLKWLLAGVLFSLLKITTICHLRCSHLFTLYCIYIFTIILFRHFNLIAGRSTVVSTVAIDSVKITDLFR